MEWAIVYFCLGVIAGILYEIHHTLNELLSVYRNVDEMNDYIRKNKED